MPYYERHLPHWQPEEAWLFVTWRLAGSLPSSAIKTPAAMSAGKAFVSLDRVLDQAASGPVWLKDHRVASMVGDVFRQAESLQKQCRLGCYVVMSNHVHLLVLPLVPAAKMTRWVKGVSARSANQILNRTGEPFWQHESFDHWVRDSREYDRILRYIELNPVRAGLVDSPELWRWSSASTGRRGQAEAYPTGEGIGIERLWTDILSFSMPIMDVNEIRQILPHRYPFLLVDRIVELEAERIVGIKNVTVNEPFFTGHFPDFPVMPGVLIIEAMAQTAGVLVLKSIPDRDSKLVLLVSVDAARFRKPVVPGDQLRIEMTTIRRKGTVAKMTGRATVDGVLVAEAEVMCSLQDKPASA